MRRQVTILLLISISIFLISSPVYAQLANPEVHPGALKCWPCHIRFSYEQPYGENLTAPVRLGAVLQFNSCNKDPCHYIGGLERRRAIHAKSPNSRVCKNCHASKNGTYQLHTIHLKPESVLDNIPKNVILYKEYTWSLSSNVTSKVKRDPVECALCHWSSEGYNSSLANVPPFEEIYTSDKVIKKSSIRKPPWNNDCGYCHPSVRGAERLHDVHEPVIFKACIICHSPTMSGRDDFAIQQFGRPFPNGGKKDVPTSKTKKTIKQVRGSLPGREFSRLFEKIAEYLLTIFNTARK